MAIDFFVVIVRASSRKIMCFFTQPLRHLGTLRTLCVFTRMIPIDVNLVSFALMANDNLYMFLVFIVPDIQKVDARRQILCRYLNIIDAGMKWLLNIL